MPTAYISLFEVALGVTFIYMRFFLFMPYMNLRSNTVKFRQYRAYYFFQEAVSEGLLLEKVCFLNKTGLNSKNSLKQLILAFHGFVFWGAYYRSCE